MPKLALSRPRVIGIVGSRRRDAYGDFEAVMNAFLAVYRDGDRVVSGGCKMGGDWFAECIARDKGLTIVIHHADWKRHGRSAGFIRNTRIAEDADVLLALVAPDRKGGTEDTIRKALRLGKEVILV